MGAVIAFIAYISNLEYFLLTFLLLTVYHHIFQDRVGRNDVWNIGYGGKSIYILVFASLIAWREVCLGRTEGVEHPMVLNETYLLSYNLYEMHQQVSMCIGCWISICYGRQIKVDLRIWKTIYLKYIIGLMYHNFQ